MSLRQLFNKRKRVPPPASDVILLKLLHGVWDIPRTRGHPLQDLTSARAYRSHYEDGVDRKDLPDVTAQGVQLVTTVKAHARESLREIKIAIQGTLSSQHRRLHSDEELKGVLTAIIRLWLFTTIRIDNESLSLSQALQIALPPQQQALTQLSEDFSAKSLARKAGIRFEYSSDIGAHLSISSNDAVVIFRHARILSHLDGGEFADLFPVAFLEEVERTFRLLFPTHGGRTSRRTRRLERKREVELDVEVGPEDLSIRDLATYHYFGPRLAAVQRLYDGSKPRKLKQWWFDRRRRVEWATFMLAVIVFMLTIVFGVISSVTGILQVYASFKALKSG